MIQLPTKMRWTLLCAASALSVAVEPVPRLLLLT